MASEAIDPAAAVSRARTADAVHAEPRSYLGWQLAIALLCFLPLGLVAGYYGWRTQEALQAGEPAAARLSALTRRWLIAAVVIGLALDILLLLVLLLLGAFPSA